MEESPSEIIKSLGYSQQQVKIALEVTNDDPDAALQLLMSGGLNDVTTFQNPSEEQNIPVFDTYKLVVLARQDLRMSPGKIAAQVAHAVLKAYRRTDPDMLRNWQYQGEPVIVLKVESLEQMVQLEEQARAGALKTHTICDAGRTQVDPGTMTVCAIGPDLVPKINEVTGSLSLY